MTLFRTECVSHLSCALFTLPPRATDRSLTTSLPSVTLTRESNGTRRSGLQRFSVELSMFGINAVGEATLPAISVF